MAAGFKTATVTSADVAATLTNYPTYVDLSRLGITTLAEAQSVRVYADSAKTTEWAREIVSATEMHVKVPSLTSTVEIFVDWDGVRSDYAVGATYGRNAVWSGYVLVCHLQSDATDSTGNNAAVSDNFTYVAGKIGNGVAGDGNSADRYINFGDLNSQFTGDNAHATVLVKLNTATPADSFDTGLWHLNGAAARSHYPFSNGSVYDGSFNTTRPGFTPDAGIDRTTWHKVTVTTESGSNNWKFYQNNNVIHQQTGTASFSLGTKVYLGASAEDARIPRYYIDGELDEFRMANFTPNGNWVTTESNNQNDEAGFWGTWSDAGGGGGGGAAQAARRGVIMMM